MTEHDHDANAAPFIPPDAGEREQVVLHGIDPDFKPGFPTKPTKGTKTTPAATHAALVLTLGGAPSSPHRLADAPGYYRPDQPTPVGGPGEPTLEHAKQLAAAPGAPVQLVYLTDRQQHEARGRHAQDIADARAAVVAARPHAAGGEVEHLADEINTTREG